MVLRCSYSSFFFRSVCQIQCGATPSGCFISQMIPLENKNMCISKQQVEYPKHLEDTTGSSACDAFSQDGRRHPTEACDDGNTWDQAGGNGFKRKDELTE